jgi:hypothetical protein
MKEFGMKIIQEYENIYLIEKNANNTLQELKDTFPNRRICVCDFYVADSEKDKDLKKGAFSFGDLLIIDHHLDIPKMCRHICSTTLAINYVTKYGPLDDEYVVVINHTDTDSILSSLIMRGKLEPRGEYSKAAIAADHTGKENVISDILQSLEDDKRLQNSIEILQKVVKNRLCVRQTLKAMSDNNEFKFEGGVAYKILEGKIDAGLVPWIFPHADAIVVAWLMPPGSKGKWGIKIRLGSNTKGISLKKMGLPDAAGRWNAFSTTRHGGTNIEPQKYAEIVKNGIERLKKNGSGSNLIRN